MCRGFWGRVSLRRRRGGEWTGLVCGGVRSGVIRDMACINSVVEAMERCELLVWTYCTRVACAAMTFVS